MLTNQPTWLRRLLAPFRQQSDSTPPKRPYVAAQIEVTSRCFTECVFCAQPALGEQWIAGDLPLEVYREHIVPHLDLFDLVYLQGWGEPLLHGDLWEMLALARGRGCRTGFTTNGMLLSAPNRQHLLDHQVELLSISLAGACPDTHERLRRNTRFEIIARHISALQVLKHSQGTKFPTLEMHFLMTRANMAELPDFVRLAAELGADEAVATNLTNTPTLEQENQRVFAAQPAAADLEIVSQARQAAQQAGLRFNVYPLEMQDQVLVCDANPLETIYINHMGEVTPCVNLGLCAQGAIPRYFLGEAYPTPRMNFGNVRQGLPAALESAQRQAFCQAFRRRNVTANPLVAFSALSGVSKDEKLPPPPEPCRACYKMYGV